MQIGRLRQIGSRTTPNDALTGNDVNIEHGRQPNKHSVAAHIHIHDITPCSIGICHAHAKSTTLPNCVRMRAVVHSEHVAGHRVLDLTRFRPEVVFQPALRVTVGDEANVVTVWLVSHQ